MIKPKRKAGMGYILILLLILIVFAVVGVFISKRFAPSKAQVNLEEYYNLTAKDSSERPAALNDELAVIIDDTILDGSRPSQFRAVRSGNDIYVGMSFVQEHIDERFYYDANEELLIFTNALESYVSGVGGSVYSDSEGEHDAGYIISREFGDGLYINLAYVSLRTGITYSVSTDPGRVYIQQETGTMNYVTANTDIRMRASSNKKASIVTQLNKDARMKVIGKEEGWYKVIDDNGFIGYVQSNFVSDIFTGTVDSDYVDPEYTHILMDDTINMVWHGIYYYESNQYVSEYTANMTGVNVLAPTWFLFADPYGNILSYADWDYLNHAHENGWQVWAVLEDMDGESCVEILPYTSRRQAAVSQMINECLTYGIDGINVDLETVTQSLGTDFIQFIRELSVECRKNGLVLSVDDYAPYSYNAFRHTDEQSRICDYVAIMAYDDYVGGNEAGPNAGLPFLQEVMQLCTTTVDMSRLIVGLPFYTRIWFENYDGTVTKDTVEMGDVDDIVWRHGLTFEWMADVGYEYTEYEIDNAKVRMWVENAKSLEEKLKLIQEYNVAGIAGWRLGQETDDVWAVLEKYY